MRAHEKERGALQQLGLRRCNFDQRSVGTSGFIFVAEALVGLAEDFVDLRIFGIVVLPLQRERAQLGPFAARGERFAQLVVALAIFWIGAQLRRQLVDALLRRASALRPICIG